MTLDQARERLAYRRSVVIRIEQELDAAIKARDRAEEDLYDAEDAD